MTGPCRALVAAWLAALAPLGIGFATDQPPASIRVAVTDRALLERLSSIVSIDDVRDGEVVAVASPEQLAALAAAGFNWAPGATEIRAPAAICPPGWPADPNRSFDCYPSYDQYVALLHALAERYPAICRLHDLGPAANQVRPHRLWALRITDNPDLEEPEPELLLTSTMHGDEASGFVLLLRLADELLVGFDSDPDITQLVQELEIWINPNANPDGTYFSSDETIDGAIRYYVTPSGGSSFVDPNRNFPDPDEGDHPDGHQWWPETQAMMAFAAAHSITLSANLHDGAELVNYPWDTWSRRHGDDALLVHLSRSWAELAQADGPAGYMTDRDDGVTNGWDWYPVAGGRQDFMTYWHSDRELTVELSHTKSPPGGVLDEMWSWNRRALLTFLSQAGLGIHGLVTGPGGEPVAATVELVGLDSAIDNSFARTDPDVGDYHRLALPGSYDVRISATGYQSRQIEDVTVRSESATLVDVTLQPAQITLTGRVTTPATRLPIAGAIVELVGTAHTAVSGSDGSYTLSGFPPQGSYTVRASADRFEAVELTLSVAAPPGSLDLALAPLSFRPIATLAPGR